MEEVVHVPAREFAVSGNFADTIFVTFAEQLHADHGKNEDDDGQHQGQVAQGTHGVPDDLDQHVQGGPGLGQLEDSELRRKPVKTK